MSHQNRSNRNSKCGEFTALSTSELHQVEGGAEPVAGKLAPGVQGYFDLREAVKIVSAKDVAKLVGTLQGPTIHF